MSVARARLLWEWGGYWDDDVSVARARLPWEGVGVGTMM